MKKLTRTKAQAWKACQALWKELARTGAPYKGNTNAYRKYEIKNDSAECPLCQYTKDKKLDCNDCPKVWKGISCVSSPDYLLNKWEEATTIEERKAAAKAIWKLPMRRSR